MPEHLDDRAAGSSSGRPALAFTSTGALCAALVSLALAAAGWSSPWVPTEQGPEWERVQRALGVNDPRTFISWWTSVLFLLAAAGSVAAAGVAPARRRVRRFAWWVVAVSLVWMSVDHAVAIHEHLGALTAGVLPGPLGSRPVEVVLALLLLPAGVVLVVGARWRQRVVLGCALMAYLTGAVGMASGAVQLPLSPHRTSLVEALAEWIGVLLLLLAATWERPGSR